MRKWYNNALYLTLAIVFLYPLGLFGMYKSNFSKSSKLRVLIPSLFVLLGVGLSSGTKKVDKFHVFEQGNKQEEVAEYSSTLFDKHQDLENAILLTSDHKAFKIEKSDDNLNVKEIPIVSLSQFVHK